MVQLSRRSLLTALPAAIVARRVLGQVAAAPISVKRLSSFTLNVGRGFERTGGGTNTFNCDNPGMNFISNNGLAALAGCTASVTHLNQ